MATNKEYFLNSTNISIFPASNRDSAYDVKARLLSETNLTNIIKSIASKDSFIISSKYTDKPFKFVIGGYLVDVNDFSVVLNALHSSDLWANIKIDSSSDGLSILLGNDNSSNRTYTGVRFCDKKEGDGYWLQLGKYDPKTNTVSIPTESHQKFTYYDFDSDYFDCGYTHEAVDVSDIDYNWRKS